MNSKKFTFTAFGILLFVCSTLTKNINHNEKSIYTAIDYLYWQASADQMQYAVTFPNGLTELFSVSSAIANNQQFKASPGMRAKMGYFFCDGWDAVLAWTRFKSCSFACTQGNNNSVLASGIFTLLDNVAGSAATSHWLFKLDDFDIEFGYESDIGNALTIRPYFGIKGAFINQIQSINYLGLGNGTFNAHLERKHRFISFGPRLGFDEKWYIYNNFSVLGNIATALLYGKFNLINEYSLFNATETTAGPITFDCRKRLYPMMELMLGLCWEKSCDNYPTIQAAIAYELQYWWNQSQNVSSPAALLSNGVAIPGDVKTHGLTMRLGIFF